MKYPQIQALVPNGEHFDESAIVNEGGWVSSGHLDAMESALAATAALNTKVEELAGQLNTSQTALQEKETHLAAANEQVTANAAKIVELEGKLAAYGQQPSGSGSSVKVSNEIVKEDSGEGKVFKLDDPNHPQNRVFESTLKRYKGFK